MPKAPGFYGKGWGFPIRPGSDGALPWAVGEDAIRNSIFLILSTAQGERLMRPDYGCGIHDLVFQANTTALRGDVEVRVQDALLKWEPRIDVLDVRAETSPDAPTRLLVRLDYRLRTNNAVYNLVYPFYLQEGTSS